MRQLFTFATLSELDGGRIAEAINAKLRMLVADCRDRPTNKRPRKLTMVLSLKPILDEETGELYSCEFAADAKVALPNLQSRIFDMMVTDAGLLVVNDLSPDEARQLTIDDVPEPKRIPDAS